MRVLPLLEARGSPTARLLTKNFAVNHKEQGCEIDRAHLLQNQRALPSGRSQNGKSTRSPCNLNSTSVPVHNDHLLINYITKLATSA